MILLTYRSQNQSSNDSLKAKQCKDIDHISLLETFAKAENLFKKYVRLAKKHKIPISDKIELYPKITSAKSYYGECLDRSDHIEIRISEIAFEDNVLEETIMHELCHTIDGCWKHNQTFYYWLDRFKSIVSI